MKAPTRAATAIATLAAAYGVRGRIGAVEVPLTGKLPIDLLDLQPFPGAVIELRQSIVRLDVDMHSSREDLGCLHGAAERAGDDAIDRHAFEAFAKPLGVAPAALREGGVDALAQVLLRLGAVGVAMAR